jgi:hypothetical protein
MWVLLDNLKWGLHVQTLMLNFKFMQYQVRGLVNVQRVEISDFAVFAQFFTMAWLISSSFSPCLIAKRLDTVTKLISLNFLYVACHLGKNKICLPNSVSSFPLIFIVMEL